MKMLTSKLLTLMSLCLAGLAAQAQSSTALSEHVKKDIARHRAMAKAHEDAARCMESGQTEERCQKALLAACKGLAIGKYCGLKHEH